MAELDKPLQWCYALVTFISSFASQERIMRNSRNYPDYIDSTDPMFSWKDAFISLGIAGGIAVTAGATIAYSLGMQLSSFLAAVF